MSEGTLGEREEKSLSKLVLRIRDVEKNSPKNVLTISSTQGWVNQKDRWARNMAGESLKNYTRIQKGDFSYNRGNSKTYPYGCMFRLDDYQDAVVPNIYHSFRINCDELDSDYLQQFFWFGGLDEQLRGILTSSVRDNGLLNITADSFFALEVSFPSLPEQKKIAAILTSVDEVIEATQKQIDKLQDLKKATMNELLTKGIGHTEFKDSELGRIPKSWEVLPLGEISVVQSGIAKSSKEIDDFLEVPYLRVANVQDGYLDLTEVKLIKIPRSKLKRYLLQHGDVLMNEGGDFDKLGRGTVWQDEVKTCVHQNHVFVVRPDKSRLLPFFLKLFAGSEIGKQYFINNSKQSTNLASINSTQLKDMPIPKPSINEQAAILEKFEPQEKCIALLNRKLTQTQALKKSLMQDLLTGKVRIKVD